MFTLTFFEILLSEGKSQKFARKISVAQFRYSQIIFLPFTVQTQSSWGVLQKRCSQKFHKIYRKENTCARVSFLIKLQAQGRNFIKKETLAQVFSCEFCEISKNNFFTEHLQTTASFFINLLCVCPLSFTGLAVGLSDTNKNL